MLLVSVKIAPGPDNVIMPLRLLALSARTTPVTLTEALTMSRAADAVSKIWPPFAIIEPLLLTSAVTALPSAP